MRNKLFMLIVKAVAVVSLLTALLNYALAESSLHPDEAVEKALDWLAQSQNTDGSWPGEPAALNTSSVVEMLNALQQFPDYGNDAVEWLIENKPANNDFLARYLSINQLTGFYDQEELLFAQNSDGGWGLAKGYASSTLDTMLALKPLINGHTPDSDNVLRGVTFLLNQQNADGSWSYITPDIPSISLTAEVAITLSNLSVKTGLTSNQLEASLHKAGEYLLGLLGEDGTWGIDGENINRTLLAYRAVLNIMGQKHIENVEEKIRDAQQENGSWYNDPYTTALAVTALIESAATPTASINDINTFKYVEEEKIETDIFKPYELTFFEVDADYNPEEASILVLVKYPDGTLIGTENEEGYSWNVENSEPGTYIVVAIIKEIETGKVIDSFEKAISVHECFNITNVILVVEPKSIRVGDTVQPSILVSLVNQSNVDGEVEIRTVATAEDGPVVFEGISSLLVGYKDLIINLPTFTFEPQTENPLDYQVRVEVLHEGQMILAAERIFSVLPPPPPTRIDLTQQLNKDLLYPGSDSVKAMFEFIGEGTPESPQRNPIDLILAIDNSGSMEWGNTDWVTEKPNRLDHAIEASKYIIDLLQPDDRAGIVQYAGTVWVQQGLTSDKELLKKRLDETPPSPWNGTAIGLGLQRSIQVLDEGKLADRDQIIVILSDGDDNRWTISAILNQANIANQKNITIYSIGLGSGADQDLLISIAAIGQGSYVFSPTMEDLHEMMSVLAEEIFNIAGQNVILTTTIPVSEMNIDESNLSPAPSSIVYNPDGSITSTWEWDKIIMGQEKHVEITYEGTELLSGTTIILTTETRLTYLDRNDTTETIDMPNLVIPVNLYRLATEITTDKLVYSSGEHVNIAVEAENLTEFACSLTGQVEIIDAGGKVVEVIAQELEVYWDPGETRVFNFQWNTGGTLAGEYLARISWFEGQKLISEGETAFAIAPDGAVTNNVVTDKVEYTSNQPVAIMETIQNRSSNMVETGLILHTSIRDSNGIVFWHSELQIREMLPGESVSFNNTWNTGQNSPGEYTVTSIISKEGVILSEISAVFLIISSAETLQGVTGKIELETRKIYPADDVTIFTSITNTGNVALADIQTRIRIVDPGTDSIIETIWDSVSIDIGQTILKTDIFTHDPLDIGSYLVIYDAVFSDGRSVSLGSTGFQVEKPFTATKNRVVRPRALVWAENESNITLARETLCEMDVYYKIVSNRREFMSELLTDKYNLYILLDSKLPLTGINNKILADEIARGKGIIATRDANGDSLRNFGVFGVKFRGHNPLHEYTVYFDADSPFGDMSLTGSGKTQHVIVEEGEQYAFLVSRNRSTPAVVYNEYQEGKAMLFTFDLGSASGDIKTILCRAVEIVAPVEEYSNNVLEFEVTVEAHAAVDAKIIESVTPEDINMLWVSPEGPDSMQWNFATRAGETYVIRYIAKLPDESAEASFVTEAYYFAGDGYKLFDTVTYLVTNPCSEVALSGFDNLLNRLGGN